MIDHKAARSEVYHRAVERHRHKPMSALGIAYGPRPLPAMRQIFDRCTTGDAEALSWLARWVTRGQPKP